MRAEPLAEASLEGAAELDFVDALLDATERLCDRVPGLAETDRTMFTLAVCEIATNIAEHALPRGDETVRLRVTLSIDADAMQAVFVDTGHPATLDLGAVALPGDDAESGRGLAIVRASVDDLSHDADDGNTWRILRRRRTG